jgi:NADH-ubiquinone oxidoreductase chain 1
MLSLIETLGLIVPNLIFVAYVTVGERKTMGSLQRRIGPNIVGYYGLLQAFADALKLIFKENISPTQSNLYLFFLGPIVNLIFSLLSYNVIPFGYGLSYSDFNLGILYILAVSSLATYGILIAGWSANSKYAFLGSLRSTAQLISYELIISSAILLVILFTGSLNLNVIIEFQKPIWFIFPLFIIFIIFFISCIAETNRAPFDLTEAESELVSGFMTEHSAVVFVFFFLAEYTSIVIICYISSIIFFGGYLNIFGIFNQIYIIFFNIFNLQLIYIIFYKYIVLIEIDFKTIIEEDYIYLYEDIINIYINLKENIFIKNYISSFNIGLKTCILIFMFFLIRACYPRIRFDNLMLYCWIVLLPILIGFIIFIPCILNIFDSLPLFITLL